MASKTLTEKQNATIRNHKYSLTNESLLEPYLEIYWTWLSKKLPNHWAPNAITLAGVIVNIVCGGTILYYTNDAMDQAPRWVYLLNALGVFAYQTIDSLDGHQARRIGVDCPFDEFFDHGCDAFSSGLIILGSMAAAKMGHLPMLLLAQQCMVGLCFYMSHFQAYVTGTMYFGLFDAIEGQWLAILTHLTCAIWSPDVFNTMVPFVDMSLRHLACILSLFAFALFILRRFGVVLKHWSKHKATINGHSALFPALPIITLVSLEVFLATQTTLYTNNKCLFLVSFGIVLAKLVNFLVVTIITEEPVPVLDTWIVGPLVLCASPILTQFISNFYLLILVFIFNATHFVKYFAQTCVQFEDALDMYTFTITSRPSELKDFTTETLSIGKNEGKINTEKKQGCNNNVKKD